MRILQIHNLYAQAGGEDTIADTEVALLRAAGHEVERYRVRNADNGARAAASYALAPWNPAQARDMLARVHRAPPHVAHVHNTWFTLSPSIFAALRRARVPVVMTIQNFRLVCAQGTLFRNGRVCTDCVGTHPWRAVKYSCYRGSKTESAVAAATIAANRRIGTWEGIDRFFVPSQFVKGVLLAAGFAPDRLTVKPNVVDDPGPRERPPSRSQTVLYVGRLSSEKGPEVVLDAWEMAGPAIPGLELVFVGDGPLRAELEGRAIPNVRFLGRLEPSEISGQMLQARALVFPTQCNENFGRSIVEAMAAEMPVLASDLATPAELVGEIGPEWVVLPYEREAWVEALKSLADDQAVDVAGQKARRLYEQKYTPAIGVRSLVETYEAIQGLGTDPGRRSG